MAKLRMPVKIRDAAPMLAVFLFFCLLTAVAYLMHERFQRKQVAEHAGADAKQFQWGLQNGINANLHRSRELAGYVAASPALTMPGF